MNIIISDGHSIYCPQCFSNNLIRDFHHSEFYCGDCGLVVMDNSFSLTSEINNYDYVENREKELYKHLGLNKTKSDKPILTYGDIFNDILIDIKNKKEAEAKIKKAKRKKKKKKK